MKDMRLGVRVRSALLLMALALPSAADVWDEAYTRGLNAIKAENYGLAVDELQRAIADQPNEFISEKQPRNGYSAYLPHYYLGIARINTGDLRGALKAWKISEQQGVALKNAHYAEQLRNWIARVSAQIDAFSEFGRATEAQKDALSAGAGHLETYQKAQRMLQEAMDTYSNAGHLPLLRAEDTAAYRRSFDLATEAKMLFVAAANETNARKAPAKGPPTSLTPVMASPQPQPPLVTSTQPVQTATVATATVATATVATAAPSPLPVDAQLQWEANIAFNTPDQIQLDESRVIKLLLDVHRPGPELQQQLDEPEKTATATIKISDTVEARLTGAAFSIHPITPELQAVSIEETTEWQWEVTPRQEGKHRLFLTVNRIVGSGTDQRQHSIRTFDRVIDVRVPPRAAGGWVIPIAVLAGIVVVLLLIFALRRRTPRTIDETVPIGDATVPAGSTIVSSDSVRFRPNDLIGGRYRIIRLLGEGGMGAVYAAEDGEFEGELVALKTILAQGQQPERMLARFKKEIQLARRVAHPNVSRIFDVGYHGTAAGKTIFVSMEYVTGVPLKTVIQQKGRLNEAEARAIIRDVAGALDATHAAGLIHRDVKSANVMLADDGRAVLMDFGVACLSNPDEGEPSLTKTGVIVGTPAYMAPEQIEGGTLTPATDIYAFGMVIYEMVTGRLPYEGDTPMHILAKRLRERPRSPADFVPNLKAEWERTILRCLEHDPAKRFRSAMEVSRALDGGAEMPTLTM